MLAHSPVSMSNEVYGYIYANLKSNFKWGNSEWNNSLDKTDTVEYSSKNYLIILL